VISGSASVSAAPFPSSLSACSFRFFFFCFFDGGFDSSPSLPPFLSVSRAARNDAVSSSSSTAAYSAHAECCAASVFTRSQRVACTSAAVISPPAPLKKHGGEGGRGRGWEEGMLGVLGSTEQ
jgi:hypothetical protein